MLTKTLTEGLESYAIGPKLRTLRLKKKLGLVQLGQHTGLSPALLSKIERGRLFPTLPTLLRISLVFGVGLEHFFINQEEPTPTVVRQADRLKFPSHPDAKQPPYHFECLDYPATERPMSSFFVEFNAVSSPEGLTHEHPGVEMIYLIDGQLVVTTDGKEYTLDAGDSLYMRGDIPHTYRRKGSKRCTGVVVTAP